MGDYLECLERELTTVIHGLVARDTKVDTVYIGGGTYCSKPFSLGIIIKDG